MGARFLSTEVRGLLGGHHELTTYSMRKVTCWDLDLQSFSTPPRSYRSADDPPSFQMTCLGWEAVELATFSYMCCARVF